MDILNYFSSFSSNETTRGPFQGLGQHGGRLVEDVEHGGGLEGLPQTASSLQTTEEQKVGGLRLRVLGA